MSKMFCLNGRSSHEGNDGVTSHHGSRMRQYNKVALEHVCVVALLDGELDGEADIHSRLMVLKRHVEVKFALKVR